MARLWARTVTFPSVNVGDQLPVLVKWETPGSIRASRGLPPSPDAAQEEENRDICLDPAALEAYVRELLEKAFPVESIAAPGSLLEVEPLAPVRPDDTLGLSGEVVGKRREGGRGLVECMIVIDNQQGEVVGRAVATIALDVDSGGPDAPGTD